MALLALWIVRARQEHQRIALPARYLSDRAIEKNIGTLSQGYSRALGESNAARSEQVWDVLRGTEEVLCRQVRKLTEDFAGAEPRATRVRKFPILLPLSPAFERSFDLRNALRMHAGGVCEQSKDGPPSRWTVSSPSWPHAPDAAHLPLVLPVEVRRVPACLPAMARRTSKLSGWCCRKPGRSISHCWPDDGRCISRSRRSAGRRFTVFAVARSLRVVSSS